MLIEDIGADLTRALTTNSTSNAYTALSPTGTEPTSDGTWPMITDGVVASRYLRILPICLGGNNNTFGMQLWGWSRIGLDVNTLLWIPELLLEVTNTACVQTGVSGRLVLATEYFVDTITVVAGSVGEGGEIVTPANDQIGHIKVRMKGVRKFQFVFKLGGTPPTSCNALWARA